MTMLQLLLVTMFHFADMAIDVVLFFLVVRALVRQWPACWLVGFDTAGGRLVDGLLLRIQSLWAKIFRNRLSDRGKLIVAFAVFYVAWLAVHGIATVLW